MSRVAIKIQHFHGYKMSPLGTWEQLRDVTDRTYSERFRSVEHAKANGATKIKPQYMRIKRDIKGCFKLGVWGPRCFHELLSVARTQIFGVAFCTIVVGGS